MLYSDYPFGSDHMSFLNRNFFATLSIDNNGDVYKYPCYHRSCDSIDRIDMGFATAIAKMNLGAAMRAAGLLPTGPTPAPAPTPPPPAAGNWEITGTGCEMVGNCIQSKNHPSNYGN